MQFYMPTKVIQQKDCVRKNGAVFRSLGTKALIVTGRSSAKNGSLKDIEETLASENISYELFDEIKENPPVEQILEICQKYANADIDFVIGIGGGSALDASKAVALMLCYPDKGNEFLYTAQSDYNYLPIVAVPTTCGTGSEVTGAAVLTRNDKKIKQSIPFKLFPAYGFVDSRYLDSLPISIVRNTAIDALGHLIESYINPGNNPYSQMIVFEGLRTWCKCKEALISGKLDEEVKENLMLASSLAGMAIAQCGTSLPHGASYVLTYQTGMPHGKAVGYFLYGYLLYANKEEVDNILKLTEFSDLKQFGDFIIQTLDIRKEEDLLLEQCVSTLMQNKSKLSHCPYPVNEEVLREIIYSIQ